MAIGLSLLIVGFATGLKVQLHYLATGYIEPLYASAILTTVIWMVHG